MEMYPMPYQTMANGDVLEVSVSCRVSTDGVKMLKAYPAGTIFVTTMCETSKKNGYAPYYCLGDIYPVMDNTLHFLDGYPMPTKEMLKAYGEYKQFAAGQEVSLFDAAPAQPTPKTLLAEIMGDDRYSVPKVNSDGFYVKESDWYLLIRNIITKTSTMITGQSGTGKTELISLVAQKLGMEVCTYNMGTMIDPISGLLGVHRLVSGGSVFDYAKFTQDIQKPCIILLDELSRAPLSCNNILLPCLDSRRELPVDIAGGNGARNIMVHPDCVFIATANIGAEYTGTSQMDRALVDRFFIHELEYMDELNEVKVLMKRCKIKEKDAKIVVGTAGIVRNLYKKGELGSTISTRETLSAGRMISDGWTTMEAMERSFLPFYEGTKAEGERAIVYKTFLRH